MHASGYLQLTRIMDKWEATRTVYVFPQDVLFVEPHGDHFRLYLPGKRSIVVAEDRAELLTALGNAKAAAIQKGQGRDAT